MTLIYLQTGAPGEGDTALADAGEAEFRTARGYNRPEAGAEVVYTDASEIQSDYEAQGAEVYDLDAEPVAGLGLEAMSFDDLYEKTQELDIGGRSHMDKGEMIEAIRSAQNNS